MGSSCVPETPQRVVVMDGEVTFDPVVALGVEPVGAPVPNYTGGIPDHLLERVDGEVARVGTFNEPSLESIANLEPDLILGVSKSLESGYDRLSEIAPTVATGYEDPSDWKETLREVARILNRESEADQLLADYDRRVEDLREGLGGRVEDTTVSVVRATDLGFRYLTLRGSLPGSVLNDVGLSTPSEQDDETDDPYLELSGEEIPIIEADYIFVTVDEGQDAALDDLRSNPLWDGLEGEAGRGALHPLGLRQRTHGQRGPGRPRRAPVGRKIKVEKTKRIANERWEDETSARRYAERSDAVAGEKKRLWLDIIREQAGESPECETPKRVLDVGTGVGLLALLYAELGHEVTGLDFSRAMLEQAQGRAERHGAAVEFVHGDAEDLPFEDGSFDVVTKPDRALVTPQPPASRCASGRGC